MRIIIFVRFLKVQEGTALFLVLYSKSRWSEQWQSIADTRIKKNRYYTAEEVIFIVQGKDRRLKLEQEDFLYPAVKVMMILNSELERQFMKKGKRTMLIIRRHVEFLLK
jgi:hypothetical protein